MSRVHVRSANIHDSLRSLQVPLDKLVLDPRNARVHPERNIEAIKASLARFGQRKPIVVQKKGMVVRAGNGMVVAARALGWKKIAAVVVAEADKEAAAFAITDNRVGETSEWNVAELVSQLDALDQEMRDAMAFSDDDIRDLLDRRDDPFVTSRVSIEILRPHPRNYRKHPDDQLAHLAASIRMHGFYRNIVVARDNTILAGQGVVEAARKMGKTRVPVIRLDVAPDEPRALKVLTSDNEISHLAEVDDRALAELLREIMGSDGGLAGTGFDDQQLAALVLNTRPASEIEDKAQAEEWVGMPSYEVGEDPVRVVVAFASDADRERFMTSIGASVVNKKTARAWSIWWPERQKEDLASVRFEG